MLPVVTFARPAGEHDDKISRPCDFIYELFGAMVERGHLMHRGIASLYFRLSDSMSVNTKPDCGVPIISFTIGLRAIFSSSETKKPVSIAYCR